MRSSMAGVILAGGMVGTGGGALRRIRECQDRAQGRGKLRSVSALSARGSAQAQSTPTETASVRLVFLGACCGLAQSPLP
jgi:hypothetical protein